MKIVMTFAEILEHGNWDAFCGNRGYDEYMLKEGKADHFDEETFTPEEAESFGLAPYIERALRGAS